jgi:hypothetical protein
VFERLNNKVSTGVSVSKVFKLLMDEKRAIRYFLAAAAAADFFNDHIREQRKLSCYLFLLHAFVKVGIFVDFSLPAR